MLAVRNYINDSIFDNLFSISRDIDRFFEDNRLEDLYLNKGNFPSVNVYDDKNNYYISAEVPGIKKEDLKINVTSNGITIEGERNSEEVDSENISYHRNERSFGRFSRTFTFGEKIDVDKIGAEIKEGILAMTLPKKEFDVPKQIEIK